MDSPVVEEAPLDTSGTHSDSGDRYAHSSKAVRNFLAQKPLSAQFQEIRGDAPPPTTQESGHPFVCTKKIYYIYNAIIIIIIKKKKKSSPKNKIIYALF